MKSIVKGLIVIALFSSGQAYALTTHDPATYAQMVKLLQEGKKHTEQFIRMRDEMKNINNAIGYFKDDKASLTNKLLRWGTYYDGIDTLDSEKFSAFKWLGIDALHPENYAYNTTDFIRSKFNSDKAFDDVKGQLINDEKHPEEMRYRRQELAHNSITSSIVVSNRNKQDIKNVKKNIDAAVKDSMVATDLTQAIKEMTKMLGIIAHEQVKTNELLSQQLELQSSFFVNFQGTGKLVAPSNKLNTKKGF